jgi:putative ABC transport system permease protein
MFRNYFKITIRNLVRNKIFSFINIAGLSMGLACCILILLYTKDEVSFDRFHAKKDQLFQLTCHRISDGEDKHFAIAAMVQGPAFREAIPEVEEFVRVNNHPMVVKMKDAAFTERCTWADKNFFTIFSFPLIAGDPQRVLSDIHSIVITDEIANKYFGTTHAVGKTMELDIDGKFEQFIVSGIARKAPQNSSIKFNILLPFKYLEETHPDNGWMWVSYPTYFIINPKANIPAVESKMNRIFNMRAKTELDENKLLGYDSKFIWGVQPFVQMHLKTEFEGTPEAGNPVYYYILTGIAVFILLIACINFINLTIAQSLRRSKEIGIRKVIGSRQNQLVGQFLGESFFICFIAFVLAILLALIFLPIFNELTNKKLSLDYLFDFQLISVFILLFLVTGFLAGFYPALVLSRFDPVETLYSRANFSGRNYLAKSLVVLQFAIATFLIISTVFIYAQFNYLTYTSMGYNDKNLLEITTEKAIMNKGWTDAFKTEIAAIPGVERIASRNIGRFGGKTKAGGKEFQAFYEHVDENYLQVLEVPFVAGRNFLKNFRADSTNAVIVNETFIKEAGWKEAVGKTIDYMNFPDWGDRKIRIVGVVKDYHFESLKEKIKPQVFTLDPRLPLGEFLIRIRPNGIPQTLKSIEKVYQQLNPFHPFQYYFREEQNNKSYESEAKGKQVITFGAIITILISCIGLFGLSSLTIQKRTKEIGIRKVFGASVSQMTKMVSVDFVKLVFIAFLIAIPAALYCINIWLQNFAYRISISWWLVAIAGLLMLFVAMVTVSYNAVKAGAMNPVNSLRNQ